jgi:pimeloyl-ACP methyl ester carboxylesterase
VRLQQHRNIEVCGATLECTLYGSGTPVVLLANAGCSTGYFDDLARVLVASGLQAICVNMRGTGESRGSLDGLTVHDLAADVAGVLEAWIAVRRTWSAMPSAIGSLAVWRPTDRRWCVA